MTLNKNQLLRARAERFANLLVVKKIDAALVYQPKMLQWLTLQSAEKPVWLDTATGELNFGCPIPALATISKLGIVGNVPPSAVAPIVTQAVPVVDVTEEAISARRKKDIVELSFLKKAAEVTKKALHGIPWKAMKSQQALAHSMIEKIWAEGADGWAYDPSIACDAETINIWSEPSAESFSSSSRLVMDAAAAYRGYKADCTVTLERHRSSRYSALVDIIADLTAAISGGLRDCSEIAMKADNLLVKSGFEPLPHAIGHGVGLELHEHPFLTRKSTHRLEPGDVFMIEPAYYMPFEGSRIESMFMINFDDELVCLLDAPAIGEKIERYW